MSKLKPPSKIGKPTALQQPKAGGVSATPGSSRGQSALEKSARAAGVPMAMMEKYSGEIARKLAGPEPQPPVIQDDFIIGDRVWVGGTKPGKIAFIGETKFAPGEWAGIVLDEPVGKNDGSVGGVRYFQCEAKKGVFARVSKLSRGPAEASATPPTPVRAGSESANGGSAHGASAPPSTTSSSSTSSKPTGVSKPSGLVKRGSISGSQAGLNKSSSPSGSVSNLAAGAAGDGAKVSLKLGDRVLIGGTKVGHLRYLGAADFAKGEWAGVELDDPIGKNDGAVSGKRYFDCKPMHGLFAPVHKVQKIGNSILPKAQQTPKLNKYSLSSSGLTRDRSGSQESISSISSSASSISRSRASKTPTSSGRSSSLTGTPQTSALQKALKEKEEHIEQLLKERDMERSEVVRAAAQVDEAEVQLTNLKQEHERYVLETEEKMMNFTTTIDNLTQEKNTLGDKLEEEKRKVEDLQFTVEEQTINQDEAEASTESEIARIKQLETKVQEEGAKVVKLTKELETWKELLSEEKKRGKDAEDTSVAYLDQIEELTHKLTVAESKINHFETESAEKGVKSLQIDEELQGKSKRLVEVEDELAKRLNEIGQLETKVAELQMDLCENEGRRQKQQESVDDLMAKLAASDTKSSDFQTEMQQLKTQISDMQRQIAASEEKCQHLAEDKEKLEQQMSEVMKHSGDSSQQLSVMNEQLLEKDRKVADLQASLSASTQKIGKLSEELEQKTVESYKETEILVAKHEEDLKSFQQRLDDAQSSIETANAKLAKLKEKSQNELSELQQKLDSESSDLRRQLDEKVSELKVSHENVTSSESTIEQLKAELENMKTEKGDLKSKLDNELSQKEFLQAERDSMVSEKGSVDEQVQALNSEKEQLIHQKQQLEKEKSEESSAKEMLANEKDSLLEEKKKTAAELEEKNLKIHHVTQECENLKKEFNTELEKMQQSASETKKDVEKLGHVQEQLQSVQRQKEELEGRLQLHQTEREALKLQVTSLKAVQQEKQQLESQQKILHDELEDLRDRESKLRDDYEIEKTSLQNTVETTNLLLQQKEKEVDRLTNEVTVLQGETSLLNSYKSSVQNLEQDKKSLEQKVVKLEVSLQESQTNANVLSNIDTSGDAVLTQLKSEKEAADGQNNDPTLEAQIDFLNSVIVDMQRKNEELKTRLQAMESGYSNGTSEDSGLELSDKVAHKPAPRLFCDICDVFDLHDTEDCPQQAMSDSPPPSLHHRDRHEQRPYCDICEVFGHSTANCDDEQTF